MPFWNELDLRRHTATWISHEMIAIVAYAVGIVAGVYFPGNRLLWGAIAASLCAAYFTFMREPSDMEKHDLKGDSKVPGIQNVTPRIDMYGDQIGPWGPAGAAVLAYLGTLWWPAVLIAALAITALLLVMKMRLIFGGKG